MSDEIVTDLESGAADTQGVTAQDKRLSDEAAKWRTKFRELEAQMKAIEPKAAEFDKLQEAQKTEAQKMADQLANLQAQVAQAQAQADAATKQANLMRLANMAGVDPDVAAMLDLSKIDMTDDAKALQQLGKFAKPTNGAQVKPGQVGNTGATEDELRALYFGTGKPKTLIFGG